MFDKNRLELEYQYYIERGIFCLVCMGHAKEANVMFKTLVRHIIFFYELMLDSKTMIPSSFTDINQV